MYIYTEMRTLNLNEGQEGPGSGSGAATSWSWALGRVAELGPSSLISALGLCHKDAMKSKWKDAVDVL